MNTKKNLSYQNSKDYLNQKRKTDLNFTYEEMKSKLIKSDQSNFYDEAKSDIIDKALNTLNHNNKQQKLIKYSMDNNGNLLDENGKIIEFESKSNKTLNLNEKSKKSETINKNDKMPINTINKKDKNIESFSNKSSAFFDKNLQKTKKKKAVAFSFVQKGSIINKISEGIKEEAAKKYGLDSELKDNKLTNDEVNMLIKINTDNNDKLGIEYLQNNLKTDSEIIFNSNEQYIQDNEWWDKELISNNLSNLNEFMSNIDYNDEYDNVKNEDSLLKLLNLSLITKYIQHPIPIGNQRLIRLEKTSLPVFLTKKERIRIRKRKREKINSEVRDKQHLGLIDPPKPKLTYKNFMNVLSTSAVKDPSKIEEEVQKAYLNRNKKMIEDNNRRKLTAQMKKEKLKNKLEKSLALECNSMIIRLSKYPTPKQIFKLRKNIKKYCLSGFLLCVASKQLEEEVVCPLGKTREGLVVKTQIMLFLEGSKLGMNKIRSLIERRIRWGDTNVIFVWEGNSFKKVFKRFNLKVVKDESELKKFLNNKNMLFFWNNCQHSLD